MSAPLAAGARLPAGGIRRVWDGLDGPEGVAVARDGTVWATGQRGQVYRGRLDGDPELVARLPGQALGVALADDGGVYVTVIDEQHGRTQALYGVAADGEVGIVSAGSGDRPAHTPNFPLRLPSGVWLWSDSGDFDAGDQGCIFAVGVDGTRVVDTTACRFPNGLALAPDGLTVAVVESTLPGVSLLRAAADGSLSHRRVLAELPGTVPDGGAYDERGRLLVACYEPNAIFLVDPAGRVELLAHDPDGTALDRPTNLAFVPGTATVLVANLGGSALSVFEHDCAGAA